MVASDVVHPGASADEAAARVEGLPKPGVSQSRSAREDLDVAALGPG